MPKTQLSVWVLPRGPKEASQQPAQRASRSGAFIVASCKDRDLAIVPQAAGNRNRRVWPQSAPTQPRKLGR